MSDRSIIGIIEKAFRDTLPQNLPEDNKKNILYTFITTLMGLVMTNLYLFIESKYPVNIQVIIQAFFILVYILNILFIYQGKYLPAKLIFFIVSCIQHMLLADFYDENAYFQLYFLVLFFLPFFIFKNSEVIFTILALLLNTICMYLLYNTEFSIFFYEPQNAEIISKFASAVPITILVSTSLLTSYIAILNNEIEDKLMYENITLKSEFEAMYDNSSDAIFMTKTDSSQIIRCNERAIEMFKCENEAELINKFGISFHKNSFTEEERKRIHTSLLKNGIFEAEYEYKTKTGENFWGSLTIKQFYSGGLKYNLVRIYDITKIKEAEETIKNSLKEKEVLLSEIHHRVKNNMAVVSGLLYLQSLNITDANTKRHLIESQNRIKSMALIHEKLYKSNQFDEVNFKEYLIELTEQIRNSIINDSKQIEYRIECQDIMLNMTHAVPCALILNELISNAYKHAFENREKGVITIDFFVDNGNYILKVQDDGIGMDIDKMTNVNTTSLGLTLIISLVDQLEGEYKVINNNGTLFLISFKK